MTDPTIDTTVGAPEDLRPVDSEEAAEIVRQDPALNTAGSDSTGDAETDDDARTADTAPTGESRD